MARAQARRELLAERAPDGHWIGELSSSALSTATAVCALSIVGRASEAHPSRITHHASLIHRGLEWLAAHVNADGAWGDTILSLSNISTTALCWAAFGSVPGADLKYRKIVAGAENWLRQHAGGIDPEQLARAIIRRYGQDRTFSVPILTMCALAGRLGPGPEAWRRVLPLPFELAACPHQWFAALRLPVVSYALPALIAIGQARHVHLPSRNPLARLGRNLARDKTLEVLAGIQPSSGGFLEATPLTSFVVMSLAGSGRADHAVTKKGVEFLTAAARADGSWPIDSNLATWLTTLAVDALARDPHESLSANERTAIRDWLLARQYQKEHPYTHAAPGGWAWTDLPGGVPDADDTAGALLALRHLGGMDERVRAATEAGITWLLNLQNSDGGIPTFCRGWGKLPFDRSGPDLTAHALRAWAAWRSDLPDGLQKRVRVGIENAVRYLAQAQRRDGSWVPLWFGNQQAVEDENPAYGTAKVILALQEPSVSKRPGIGMLLQRGAQVLARMQRPDGSWGASPTAPPSVEETALAVEALAGLPEMRGDPLEMRPAQNEMRKGVRWLIEQVEAGAWKHPSPIGFYFAKLWYYERLYPMIFTVGALGRATAMDSGRL
ncbi:MAG: squalene--hopene cyclase [Chloroflexi bacterium]|nr:squalene--hopene cyclase [Chloroflexota bacterium]